MKKKSGKKAADRFERRLTRLNVYLDEVENNQLSDQAITWCYELMIIKAYSAFERLMLECIVVAINNDTATISETTNIKFPKHLEDSVCEYLVIGNGYFDFRGRDGLIKEVKKYVPNSHWLVGVLRSADARSLDKFIALRNFAAHGSTQSKQKALKECDCQKMASAGSWLKVRGRGQAILGELQKIGDAIRVAAPY